MTEATRPAVIRIAPQKAGPEPYRVQPGDGAASTTDFPISDAARKAEAAIVRREMNERRRPSR